MSPKKNLSNKKKKKLNFWHQPVVPQIFWPVLGVLFLFFIISIINFFSLWQLRSDLKIILGEKQNEVTDLNNNQNNNLEATVAEKEIEADVQLKLATANVIHINPLNNDLINPEINVDSVETEVKNSLDIVTEITEDNNLLQQNIVGQVASFGDSFSGLAYIDRANTNLFWDENVTAFTLPPLYTLTKQSDCTSRDCGLSRAEVDPVSLCLPIGCLRKDENNNLWFKDQALLLPPEFRGEVIREVTLFTLSDKWLIGIVSGAPTQERGWVYSFDGLAFSPLITDNTDYQIYPRYQRGGGKIFFGGDDRDFLVLYAGYDGISYRFRGSEIEDVSRFFGLRVTAGGFSAQIFKTGEGGTANYYICGLSEYRPLLLKIWSQDEMSSGGALDYSSLAFKNPFQTEQILCARSGNHSLAIAAQRGGSQELWNFTDLGFDHSQMRQVRSVNLQRKNANIKAAIIADTGLSANGSDYNFYLSNSANDFQIVEPYLWHYFSTEDDEIYWQLQVQPGTDNYRSPWFFHIHRLDYLFIN